MRKRRLSFLVRSLGTGGAERQLSVLAPALAARGHDVTVLSFYPGGPFEGELRRGGVEIVSLDKRARFDIVAFMSRLHRELSRIEPDVLHGYLQMPNIISLLGLLNSRTRVVFGVRSARIPLAGYDAPTRWSYRGEAMLARYAAAAIANSHAGKDDAVRRGFPPSRVGVIPNGFDPRLYYRDEEARSRTRKAWGVGEQRIIGVVARYDPLKDPRCFVDATIAATRRLSDVEYVWVGDAPRAVREELIERAMRGGARLRWFPTTSDVRGVYSALDLLVSSSISEGFSNVLAEAMLCEVPCVVTDVGDSSRIVAKTGWVVPPQEPEMLASAMVDALDRCPRSRGQAARQRIIDQFGMPRLIERTERFLDAVLSADPARFDVAALQRDLDAEPPDEGQPC